jgi:DNA-binding transcriptional LysR family regulator
VSQLFGGTGNRGLVLVSAGRMGRVGWGITIAPELTPAGTEAKLGRIPIDGLDTVRHNVVIVRDGEHLSPRIAAAIAAVRAVSAEPLATDAG